MFTYFRVSLLKDISDMFDKLAHSLSQVTTRVSQVKDRLSSMTAEFTNKVDCQSKQSSEISCMKLKLVDIVDRSCHNNVKFRGIPENITDQELTHFIISLLSELLPDASKSDLLIDRAHRLPRPSHLPDITLRDVLAMLPFYHIKAMQTTKQGLPLSERFQGMTL